MIAISFTFPARRYHATPWGRHANEADVAWPPEPVRILRALIATWWRKADRDRFPKPLLNSLVDELAAEPPVFRLPDAVHAHIRTYMPTPTEKKLVYDAFLRFGEDREVIVAWPGVTLAPELQALAEHLLERIGYLGRAESWAEGCLVPGWDGVFNAWPHVADAATSENVVPVDVATPLTPAAWRAVREHLAGTLDDTKKSKRIVAATLPEILAEALAVDTSEWQRAGWSSPPPLQKLVYDRPPLDPPPTRRSRPRFVSQSQPGRQEVARFVLAGRPQPRIEQTLMIAEILRWALMSGAGVPPVEFSGRDENGPLRDDPSHGHAFYLPEDADSDGLIDHLTIYCRLGFSTEARRRLDRLTRLWWEHGRADDDDERGRKEWRVALESVAVPADFANASRLLRCASIWEAVTPCLKSRFDKRRPKTFEALVETYRVQLLTEWQNRYPDKPVPSIEPMIDPGRPGHFAAPLGPGGNLRGTLAFARTRAGRGGRQPDVTGGFFRLVFDRPVEGPIALGWGAHFGLGLFRAG